jgi:hypothetical protein
MKLKNYFTARMAISTISYALILGVSVTLTMAQDASGVQNNDGSIKKGTTIVGAYFNFSTLRTSKDKVKGIDTEASTIKLGGNLTAGKMISDHWGMLLNLGYTSTNSLTPTINNGTLYNLLDDRNDFIITPSMRYYKLINEGYYLFVQTSLSMSIGTLTTDEFDKNDNLIRYDYNTTGFGFGISPGLTYFMTKKLSTEIAIGVFGFSVYNGKDNYGNKTSTTNFQSLFYQNSVSLGFVYYL